MKSNHFFTFNSTVGTGRKEPLNLEDFLSDLEGVFKKHKANSLNKGFIGFTSDGKFGISNSEFDIRNNDKEEIDALVDFLYTLDQRIEVLEKTRKSHELMDVLKDKLDKLGKFQ